MCIAGDSFAGEERMALLEKRFRKRFAIRDGGYVFRQWWPEPDHSLAIT
jgi:hypothetical protein